MPDFTLLIADSHIAAAQTLRCVAKYLQLKLKVRIDQHTTAMTLHTRHGALTGPLQLLARYMAGIRKDTSLLGRGHFESAQVDQWLWWSINEMQDVDAAAAVFLNLHLSDRTFLVGECFSLADIIVSSLRQSFDVSKFPNVQRWLDTCMNQPHVEMASEAIVAEVPQLSSSIALARDDLWSSVFGIDNAALALSQQDIVPVSPLPDSFTVAELTDRSNCELSASTADLIAEMNRAGFITYTPPDVNGTGWQHSLSFIRDLLFSRVSNHGHDLNICDNDDSHTLPQISRFQHQRYCVSFDFKRCPIDLRRFWLPQAVIGMLKSKLGSDYWLVRSELLLNAVTPLGMSSQGVHRDMADVERDGIVTWLMQVWPCTAITTMAHPCTHNTIEPLRAAETAQRASLTNSCIAFDARLQHFGNASSESQYKLSLTFVAAAEKNRFVSDSAYSPTPFCYEGIHNADLFIETNQC